MDRIPTAMTKARSPGAGSDRIVTAWRFVACQPRTKQTPRGRLRSRRRQSQRRSFKDHWTSAFRACFACPAKGA